MKRWVIVNLATLTSRYSWEDECRIPVRHRPTFVHHDRVEAEKELLRLASSHPGEFVLFESIATTK